MYSLDVALMIFISLIHLESAITEASRKPRLTTRESSMKSNWLVVLLLSSTSPNTGSLNKA